MSYTDEISCYDRTGMSTEIIQKVLGKTETQVSALVSGFITDATRKIREDIDYPITIIEEKHLGDGEKNQFKLGPRDERYMTLGDYDPTNNLVKVYNVAFGTRKGEKWRPDPEDCDSFTEPSVAIPTDWTGSGATITRESIVKKAGSYSVKAVFSGAGYIQYPDGTNTAYLDKNIDLYEDVFLWFRTTDKTVTFTLRLYDKDGNYEEETFEVRQNGVGQYIWLDVSAFTHGSGTIDWDDDKLQYFRIYVSGACTIYVDNFCFADSWTFTAPEGIIHTSVADNISSEGPMSERYPFYVTYGYDPFLASTPANIAEAAEYLVGISIIDVLRGARYGQTSFQVYGDTLELDQDSSREAVLGLRTYFMREYWRCLSRWGGASYPLIE